MTGANKLEIVNAAISGDSPARIPFSCWYHFGMQHATGAEMAAASLGFFHHYDLDFLKVMDDFGYPFPEGFEWFREEDDYGRLAEIRNPRDFDGYKRQLECLEIIGREIKGKAHFINTVFSPFTWLRNYGWKIWRKAMLDDTPVFLGAMEAAAENIEKYVIAQAELGISGIFYSQPAADPDHMSRKEFETLIRPFDLKILNAVEDLPFNVLHVHGEGIYMESFFDYPVKVINYSDRHPKNPPLAKVRKQKPGWCLMGGINEDIAKENDPGAIRQEINGAFRATEGKGWICAPGCSLKSNIWETHIIAMRNATRSLSVKNDQNKTESAQT